MLLCLNILTALILMLSTAKAQTTPTITTNTQLKDEIDAWIAGNAYNRTAIGTWNVSGLADFSYAFHAKPTFNDDISQWDTRSATNMAYMFWNARSFNQDLSTWAVDKVTHMSRMFNGADDFNKNISTWNTSSVIHFGGMFSGTDLFNQDLSSWDVSNALGMRYMFAWTNSFNQDLSSWNPVNVNDMFGMFFRAIAFDQNLCDWGSSVPSSANVNDAFKLSDCPDTSDPNLLATPPSPFCYDCSSIGTPEPTTAEPTDPPSDDDFPIPCFSANVEINIEGKGKTTMDKLVVGDKVLTQSGNYMPVYMISHFHPSKPTEFVQIWSNLDNQNPLELTPSHMIFLENKDYPIPAAQVQVGDKVYSVKGIEEVTAIHKIIREGIYNPVTTDGTIVVDGLIASTFTTYSGETHLKIRGLNLLSMQSAMSLASDPYGVLCTALSFDLCNQHDELAGISMAMRHLHNFWSDQNDFIKSIILISYLLFYGFSNVLVKYYVLVLSFVAAWSMRRTICKNKITV